MMDEFEIFGQGTLLQHGKLNDRVYLMKLNKNDFPEILDYLKTLANRYQYSKIFCKVPLWASPNFIADGFITEAFIPKFYHLSESVFFMSKFLNSDRLLDIETKQLSKLSELLLLSYSNRTHNEKLAKSYSFSEIKAEHIDQITEIYKLVFKSYPFPIHDPKYIESTMKKGVQYYGIEHNGKLVALSSSETDKEGTNAEMTDFATLPEYRGQRLSILLLIEMEKSMKAQGIKTLYTIARLNSLPMNKTFLSLGYKYSGTLINNTNISGKIESMNVYYKHI